MAENCMPLCPRHHEEIHRSLVKMAENYPAVRYWLDLAGWKRTLTGWRRMEE